jgi:serine/threonine protein kinase
VSQAALVNLFQTLKDNIRVVLLNACYSRTQAEAITEQIDCAIGMKQEVGDEAAILFAASFYRALGFGRSVREAFEQGKTALLLEGLDEQAIPELLVRKGVDPSLVVLCPSEPSPGPVRGPAPRRERTPPETDSNMLFGAMAVFTDVLDRGAFIDGCIEWAREMEGSLADLLVKTGRLTDDDRALVDQCVERKLRKHSGDVAATLAAVTDDTVREALRKSQVPEIMRSVDRLPPIQPGTPVADPSAVLAPTAYVWKNLHRQGALGQVWVGRDQGLHRDVALKVIQPERAAHPEARKRFLKEAQITGQLEHPNIVPVYAAARRPEDDQPFYVMRLLRGETLARKIADYHQARLAGKADPTERRRLLGAFLSVCHAVAYAHSRGVLHRDLKPENVVLGNFGEVHLLDWGLAKVLDQAPGDGTVVMLSEEAQHEATVDGQRTGTPSYMAPEQAANDTERVGPRTDVYGLGAVLFEVLTGRAPHEGNVGEDLYRRIAEEDAPLARSVEPSVPPALDAICARAMARNPLERYPSAAALAEAVQRWLDEEPLATYRAAVDYFKKLVQDNPRSRGDREGLARNLVNLGLMLSGMDRNADAELAILSAIAYYEGLANANPRVPNYRAELAAARLQLRNVLVSLGRKAEAETISRAALADYQQLLRVNPSDKHYHSQISSLLSVVGLSPQEIEQSRKSPIPDGSRSKAGGSSEADSVAPGPATGESGDEVAASRPDHEPPAAQPNKEPSTVDVVPPLPPDQEKEAAPPGMLAGILALEMGFISRDLFVTVLEAWGKEPRMPLLRLLVERGAISKEQYAVLDKLAAQQSIEGATGSADPGAIAGDRSVGDQLRSIADPAGLATGFGTRVEPLDAEDNAFATMAPVPFSEGQPLGTPVPGLRYRVLRLHGQGGLGSVYVAFDEALRRKVALKEIREGLADNAAVRTRFLREAEITAGLEHPGIVPVYSLGQHADGRLFYAMRLIRGITLKEAIDRLHGGAGGVADLRKPALEMRQLLQRFIEVCNTIAYVHARGVLHRDIKPGNIMIGPFGETLLLDWGLAKVLGHGLADDDDGGENLQPLRPTTDDGHTTGFGDVLGTPVFMSPEQAAGHGDVVGLASDIYSLGVTLYTVLTGSTPFSSVNRQDLLALVRNGEFTRPSQVNRTIPPGLEAVCLKAMNKDPVSRYASASELARDVERWLAGEPVSVYQEPWLSRALRRIWRR